jgi:ABC-type oligopeptide transport system substrate-binding subunit
VAPSLLTLALPWLRYRQRQRRERLEEHAYEVWLLLGGWAPSYEDGDEMRQIVTSVARTDGIGSRRGR